ncbi:hypothetical protein EK21DRAFT_57939 [Setomelanomma holmii]|uniref:Uncharacterized protein n=1 Tax=Setomelanomma holmii TaxID=210430 RepID=A0A9P4HG87_9PLEO|nr:hypothetical protein EK21DRAFT_57939 [Setomelanomma holmii]
MPTFSERITQSAPSASQAPSSGSITASPSRTRGSLPSASPIPTDMPFAPLPVSSQLSDGAKVGISISVTFLAVAIFLALGWYIRHLKRDFERAQSTTDIPDSAWRPSMTPIPTTSRLKRSGSWRRRAREAPVSPLSPEVMTIEDNGYGVLKKKRGNVLSIVVEHDNKDGRSMKGSVKEPMPGQREGLRVPLEMPLVNTPRRSLETGRAGAEGFRRGD